MDLKALDQATDYRAVFMTLWPDSGSKGDGAEVYFTPPMRPEEEVREQRFSVNLENGCWTDHKTSDKGNMLTLASGYGPKDWKDRWSHVSPSAQPILFGTRTQRDTSSDAADLSALEEYVTGSVVPGTTAYGEGSVFVSAAAGLSSTQAGTSGSQSSTSSLTWDQKAALGRRRSESSILELFADAWKVSASTLINLGSWAVCFKKGRLAGKPQLHFLMCSPGGAGCGIKQRGMEPVFQMGGKLLKSKNQAKSKTGLLGWKETTGRDVAIVVEGEKDAAVAEHLVGDTVDVIGNLGGASTFKKEWVSHFERYAKVIVIYDEDAAGNKGARKVCALLHRVTDARQAHIGVPDADIEDMVNQSGKDRDWLMDLIDGAEAPSMANPKEADDTIKAVLADEDSSELDKVQSCYEMMAEQGALFYHDESEAFCLYRNRVMRMDHNDKHWLYLMQNYMGLTAGHPSLVRHMTSMRNIAGIEGLPVRPEAWQVTKGLTELYLPMHDESQSILHITRDSISVVNNGHDGVVFLPQTVSEPLSYMPDEVYDPDRAEELFNDAFTSINANPKWQEMVGSIFRIIPFFDLMQTHPHVRFMGQAGCGKSTGGKIMTTLLYGQPQLYGGSTNAAVFRLAANMPLVYFDDIEIRELRRNPELKEIFLRSATGTTRVKSKDQSESGVVVQHLNAWLMSNGISGIAGDNSAMEERMLVIPLLDKKSLGDFWESDILRDLASERNLIMNYWFREAQRMLAALADHGLKPVISGLPKNRRRRLHEFYAMLSFARGSYSKPDARVLEWLESGQRGEEQSVIESSTLAELLFLMPSWLGDGSSGSGSDDNRDYVREPARKLDGDYWRMAVHTGTLHAILSKIKRSMSMAYNLRSTQELNTELMALAKRSDLMGLHLTRQENATRYGGKRERGWNIEVGTSVIKDAPLPLTAPNPDEDIPF